LLTDGWMDRWTISIHNPELLIVAYRWMDGHAYSCLQMDGWTISIHNPELLIVAYRWMDGHAYSCLQMDG